MYRSPHICYMLTLGLLIFVSQAQASNNYFLPGDAFFHSILTLKSIKKSEQESEPIFDYVFVCKPAFCGYAGYSRLKLDRQNQELARNIQKAYFQIRKSIPIELEGKNIIPLSATDKQLWKPENFHETNGLSIFFYNTDYDWQRRNIAIKYNEDWLGDLKLFGFGGGRYCEFVSSADAVVAAWARGKNVPPLKVKIPDTEIEKFQTVDTPMSAPGPLKALILYNRAYKQYFNMKNGMELLEITNQGMTHYIIHRKEWKKYDDVYGDDQ